MSRFPPCILSTCVVPWDEKGNFVEDLFRDQVRVMAEQGTRHLYVFGTAGEGYAVTERQFDQVVAAFVDTMRAAGCEPMVGAINLSLGTIVERITRAREQGVRLFQISLPSWGALAEGEMFDFFRHTCGRFPDCQFLHYNLMRTKRLVTAEEYALLADEHPNLVATKNSTDSMTRVHDLLLLAPQLTHFLTEDGYAHGSLLGDCGFLASVAMTNFDACRAFFEAGRRRDGATLATMQQELWAVTRDLMEAAGDAGRIDGAYDKLLWRLHDRRFPMRLLPPYHGLDESRCDDFARRLAEKHPRWKPPEM